MARGPAPVVVGGGAAAGAVVDIAGVLVERSVARAGAVGAGNATLYYFMCPLVWFMLIQYSTVCIEVSGVVRLTGYRALAHGFGIVEAEIGKR